jgi:hypothetical protein
MQPLENFPAFHGTQRFSTVFTRALPNSKNKNIRDLYRGINYFKKAYQPRSNLVKDENGDLLADAHNILNRWKNYFSELLNLVLCM